MGFYPAYEYNELINEDEEYEGELCESCINFNNCTSLKKGNLTFLDGCICYEDEGRW